MYPSIDDDGKSQMEEFEEEKDDALLGQCQPSDDEDDTDVQDDEDDEEKQEKDEDDDKDE